MPGRYTSRLSKNSRKASSVSLSFGLRERNPKPKKYYGYAGLEVETLQSFEAVPLDPRPVLNADGKGQSGHRQEKTIWDSAVNRSRSVPWPLRQSADVGSRN